MRRAIRRVRPGRGCRSGRRAGGADDHQRGSRCGRHAVRLRVRSRGRVHVPLRGRCSDDLGCRRPGWWR